MKKLLICLPVLLASTLSFAAPKFVVMQNGTRTEPTLARVGVTTQADGSALLVLYTVNDVTGTCAVKVKSAADAVALSTKIVSPAMGKSQTVFCERTNQLITDTVLHIEDEL